MRINRRKKYLTAQSTASNSMKINSPTIEKHTTAQNTASDSILTKYKLQINSNENYFTFNCRKNTSPYKVHDRTPY